MLDEGKLVEFEEPYLLLQNKDSLFSNMVEHTSQHLRTNLYETARQAYNSRHERNGDGELDACRKWSNAEATTVEQERELEPQQQEADNEDGFDDVLAMVRGSSSLEKEKLLLESTA